MQTRPGSPRLPVPPTPTRPERRREVLAGLAALLGILLVVVGVPAALLAFVGNPLPTSAPTSDWLTAEITTSVVLKTISVLVWLAWAHFLACLLVEWRAGRRGHGLPRAVLLGGGSQQLARKLVAGVLLLAGTATLVPQSTQAPAPRPAVTSTVQAGTQQVQQAGQSTAAQSAVAQAVQQAEQTGLARAERPAKAEQAQRYAYYEVQPPEGRNHDCLWDISERFLGDPLRYREVFALNKDRVQPDGRKLSDADLIRPGWILRLPADASGPGLRSVDPVNAPSAPKPVKAPAQAPSQAPAQAPAEAPAGAPQSDVTVVAAREGGDTYGFGRLAVGSGLLAAGLLVALTGRRGPFGTGSEDQAEQRLRLAADAGLAGFLDSALRHLAASMAEQGRPLPEANVVFLRADELVLHCSPSPEGAPPAPWTTSEDGGSWKVLAADLGPAPEGIAAPYPALVNIGVSHGYEVLLDLEAAPGLVSLGGAADVARGVLSGMAVELGTNLWSDEVAVTLVGFGDDISAVSPGRLRTAATLEEVLVAAEADVHRSEGLLRRLGAATVLQGRAARGTANDLVPHVLVLSGPPSQAEAERLAALVGASRTRYAAVCVGDSAVARWRFSIDSDGTLDLGLLGFTVSAHRLTPADYGALLRLLRQADETRAEAATAVTHLTPLGAATGSSPDDEVPPPGAPAATGLPAYDPHRAAAVEVQLLGAVSVSAPGAVTAERRDLLTELVVAVALRPDGLPEAVLRASVWPRGVEDDVVAAALREAQAWLGDRPGGKPRIRIEADGRWVLADDVRTDWLELVSAAAVGSGPDEGERLRTVLARVRGEAFSGTPAGHYAWLQFHQAAREARLVGVASARRLSALASSRGDRDSAEWALRRGLALVPEAEVLWRDLLRLLGDDDPSGGTAVVDEMLATLGARGVRLEAQTEALVDQLVPGHRTA